MGTVRDAPPRLETEVEDQELRPTGLYQILPQQNKENPKPPIFKSHSTSAIEGVSHTPQHVPNYGLLGTATHRFVRVEWGLSTMTNTVYKHGSWWNKSRFFKMPAEGSKPLHHTSRALSICSLTLHCWGLNAGPWLLGRYSTNWVCSQIKIVFKDTNGLHSLYIVTIPWSLASVEMTVIYPALETLKRAQIWPNLTWTL